MSRDGLTEENLRDGKAGMNMRAIRVGIIGHGFMGHKHEAMLTKMEGYQVVAIAEFNKVTCMERRVSKI